MSGRKVSAFRMREWEEKLRLVRRLVRLKAQINAMEGVVGKALGSAAPGVQAAFGGQVAAAQAWLEAARTAQKTQFSTGDAATALEAAGTQLERLAEEGGRVHEALTKTFTKEADALAGRIAAQVEAAEALRLEHATLLREWGGNQAAEKQPALLHVARLLRAQEYVQAEAALAAFREGFSASIDFAEAQEEKHQKRLYLLKALRQVCVDLGFQEVSAPRFEKESERGSAILFTVDTLNQGRIAFTLSLDGIATDSEVAGHRCADEFGAVSKYLETEFGIETEFRTVDGEPLPKLRQKGEKDLPEDAGKAAEG